MAVTLDLDRVFENDPEGRWHDGMMMARSVASVKWGASVTAYVAGPMRGIEEWNFPAFAEAAGSLRAYGWSVFSPAERDQDKQWDTEYPNARPLWEYMIDDLPAVAKASAVFFLPGWKDSEGARLEFTVAMALKIPCYEYETAGIIPPGVLMGEPIFDPVERHPNSARFHEILGGLGTLHDQKQADYGKGDDPFANVRGSQDFGVDPWIGALVRLNDKIKRLQSFITNGSLKNESVEDSLRDIAVYSIIALVLYEEMYGRAAA